MDRAEIFLEDGIKKTVDCLFYLYNSNYYFLYTEKEKDENGYIKLYLVKIGKETVNSENGLVETGNMIGIEVPTNDEWKQVQESISKIVNSKKTKVEDPNIQYLPMSMLVNLKIVSKKTFRLLADIIEKDFGISLEKIEVQNSMINNTLDDPNLNKPIEEDQQSNELENSTNLSANETSNLEQSNENIAEVPTESLKTDEMIDELDNSIDSTNKDETKEPESEEIEDSFEITTEGSETIEDDYDNQDVIIDYRTRFFEEQDKNKKLNEEIEKLNKKLSEIQEIIAKN